METMPHCERADTQPFEWGHATITIFFCSASVVGIPKEVISTCERLVA